MLFHKLFITGLVIGTLLCDASDMSFVMQNVITSYVLVYYLLGCFDARNRYCKFCACAPFS